MQHTQNFYRHGAFALAATIVAACGGPGTPSGSVVNFPGDPGPPSTDPVPVKVTIAIPALRKGIRPDYVSPNTQSLVIQLASVNGQGVSGINATTIETKRGARNCSQQRGETVCTGTAKGSPGDDVFSVTTYAGSNATGAVLSVGTVQAKIKGGGSGVPITNLSLTLYGVIASIEVSLAPDKGDRGERASADVALAAFDATGAQIVGPSDYAAPIAVSVQGDSQKAFMLHAGGHSGSTLVIPKPMAGIRLDYDGNPQSSNVNVQAQLDGSSSVGASAQFAVKGKRPPPPVGTIYALNLGANDGRGATVTEYDGKAQGDAAPERTLQLSSKLYARSIAVDSKGNLYVGFFDNQLGFSPANGTPDAGNVIEIYARGASGKTPPSAILTADPKTNTAIFPIFIAFDPSGDLVTYGATSVDANSGDAVLTYPPGSSGPAAPKHGWNFASPKVYYAGPTGLALDPSGNFYVNGALHTSLGPQNGLYVAAAGDVGNPQANVARTIPWDSTTQLPVGFTTNVGLDPSGEIFIGNSLRKGSSSVSCQGQANVYSAGASGGVTDVPPLRVLVLDGVYTTNYLCDSQRDPRPEFFPTIALYRSILFVGDDFNNAIEAYSASGQGKIKPSLTISGAATQLNAPIALAVTSISGQAKARPAYPPHALHSQ
ncbi:MAG: hypothetical protein JO263_10455 [Candidatus Eremiobacteraeota bacterium]|nr:hypothetical protein [Candidatus Eremiobacteraeota bacterium]